MAALRTLAGDVTDSTRRRGLDFARENLEARRRPHPVGRELFAQLAGEYDTRRVVLEVGRLYYIRAGSRSREELIPASDSTFALGEATHVQFVREGKRMTGVQLLSPDGQVSVVPRTK